MVQSGEITLLVGTDAASEGLNLQRLGTLINIDLPLEPYSLGAAKGPHRPYRAAPGLSRLAEPKVSRFCGRSVHQVLAQRLKNIHSIFGQIPDTLEDIWSW